MRRYATLALGLLLWSVALWFAWRFMPQYATGKAWHASQSLLICTLSVLVAVAYRHRYISAVCFSIGAFQLTTIGCSVAWIIEPWQTSPGRPICSSHFDWPLGMLAVWVAIMIAAHLWSHRNASDAT